MNPIIAELHLTPPQKRTLKSILAGRVVDLDKHDAADVVRELFAEIVETRCDLDSERDKVER